MTSKSIFIKILFLGIFFPCITFAQNTQSWTDIILHYRNGLELFERKNYVASREEFQLFIDKSTNVSASEAHNRISAEYYIVVTALYLNYPEAELLADRFVVHHADYPLAGQLFKLLGFYYFDNDDFNKSATYLEKVNSLHLSEEESLEVRLKLGVSYYNLQAYAKAITIFNSIKQYSDNQYGEIASYYSGHLNFRNENLDEAIKDFKRIENSKRYKNEAPGIIAQILYKQGKYDEVVGYTEAFLKDKNNKSGIKLDDLALLTAEVYFAKNDFVKASNYYGQYANFHSQPILPAVRYRYGYSLYRINNFNGAITNFKAIATNQDEVGQYAGYFLGITYLKNDAPNLALAAFDQAKKLKFNVAVQEDSYFNHAKVLVDLKRNAEAIKELKEFLAIYPNSKYEDEANELLSEAYLNTNDYAAAIKYIEGLSRKSQKTMATYQRITYNQGVVFFNSENFEDAIKLFDKSLANNQDLETKNQATFWKAEALSALKKYSEALPLYNVVSKSTNPELLSNLAYAQGYAFYNTKDYTSALTSFKTYIGNYKTQTDKNHYDDAMARLADCYFVNKNFAEADKLYEQAISTAKTDKDYLLFQKALALEFQNKDNEAKALYDKVVTQFPNSRYADDAFFKLGNLDFNAGNYQVAIRQYNKLILEKTQSPLLPQALLKRAVALTNIQNLEGALADYKTILNQFCDAKVAESAILGAQEILNDLSRQDEYASLIANYKKCNPTNTSLESIEYEAAKSVYFNQNYEKSIQVLLNYMQSYPASQNNFEAKYFLAESYGKVSDKPNALKFYYQVISDKKTNNISKSLIRVAEIEFATKNYQKAIQNYKALIGYASDKKELVRAWSGLSESFYQTSKFDSVLVYTREIINAGSVNLGATNKALLLQGKVYEAKGDFTKALDEYNKCIKAAKDDIGAEAKYQTCNLLFVQKKFEDCKKECLNFNNLFPDSDLWRGRAFLIYADACLLTNDKLQAKATLESLIENSEDTETINIAKEKLKKL